MDRPINTHIINQLRKHKRLSCSDTLVLLIEIRRYLEDNNLKKKYSVASFYCDWALHSYIDRNAFAQDALIEINSKLRNPNLPYDDSKLYIQTIVCAIKYAVVGDQFAKIIASIINEPFYDIDNHFMCNVIKCLVGIPFIIYENSITETKYKEIDNQINNEIRRRMCIAPNAMLYNVCTAMEFQQRIVNFMFTNVCENENSYDFEVKLANGEIRYGSFQMGK